MSDAERARLVTTVVDGDGTWISPDLLDALGGVGRRALSPVQRGALERQAIAYYDVWGAALLRVADAGWNGVGDNDRRTLLDGASSAWDAASFIRAVGSDGRRAPPPNVQATLRASVQRDATMPLACLPALWVDLSGGRPPPPATTASWGIETWRAEDADADLSFLPREHQALVLTLASWLAADCAPSSPRMARLLAVWNGMTPDARVALATAHPWTLATVAAAARLCACARTTVAAAARLCACARTTAAVADTLTVMTLRSAPECGTRGVIGRLLAAGARRRPWMRAFAPTDDDPPSVWDAWIRAARRGAIMDHDARRANAKTARAR